MNILALLQSIQPNLSNTNVRRMSRIILAMLSMTGRITMLGIHAGQEKAAATGRYSVSSMKSLTGHKCLVSSLKSISVHPEGEYFLVGDESVVTKYGKETHGLDYFFSGLLNKVVKSIAIFTLSLVSVYERHSYPLAGRAGGALSSGEGSGQSQEEKEGSQKG